MAPEEFDKLLDRRLAKSREVLGGKAEEYAFEGDRLYNFKVAARMNGTTVAEALYGMMLKHLVSIKDLVDGRLPNTRALVDEKIGDVINYHTLLEAILQEERVQSMPDPMAKSKPSFPKTLTEMRTVRGLTFQDLSIQTGISIPHLKSYENDPSCRIPETAERVLREYFSLEPKGVD